MTTIGTKLKKSREQQNISLDEVSRTTKIRVVQLEAIERGAYDELPGEVFAKGYVRSFADALGLDPAVIAMEYDEERRASGAVLPEAYQREREEAARAALEALPERHRRKIRRIRIGWIAGSVTIVTLLAASIGWILLRDDLPTSTEPAKPAVTAEEKTVPSPVEIERAVEPVVTIPEKPTTEPVAAEMAPTTTPPTSETNAQLSVTEFGVGTGVENRTLVGKGDSFSRGDRCVFWTRVVGGRDGDEISHRWLHDGEVAMSVNLPIDASHWRTYSTLQPGSAGNWIVEARDAENRLLARSTFSVRDEPVRPPEEKLIDRQPPVR
jgi:cytoskeletal protein RodZ